MMFRFYIWVMGWSGKINTWAWQGQASILKKKQRLEHEKMVRNRENFEYLEELKRKL